MALVVQKYGGTSVGTPDRIRHVARRVAATGDREHNVCVVVSAMGKSTDELLELYGLYKQATAGDVTGKRPGMLDLKGRAKYDAWAARRGTDRDAAMSGYVALVAKLAVRHG